MSKDKDTKEDRKLGKKIDQMHDKFGGRSAENITMYFASELNRLTTVLIVLTVILIILTGVHIYKLFC